MGLLLRKEDDRSQLQSKVAADVEERLRASHPLEIEKPEPAINANQHQTRPIGVIIVVLAVIAIGAVVLAVSLR